MVSGPLRSTGRECHWGENEEALNGVEQGTTQRYFVNIMILPGTTLVTACKMHGVRLKKSTDLLLHCLIYVSSSGVRSYLWVWYVSSLSSVWPARSQSYGLVHIILSPWSCLSVSLVKGMNGSVSHHSDSTWGFLSLGKVLKISLDLASWTGKERDLFHVLERLLSQTAREGLRHPCFILGSGTPEEGWESSAYIS